MAQAIQMLHQKDARAEIRRDVAASLGAIRVMGTSLLVAPYIRDGKSAGGIILTAKTTDEDKYQGKVGLVLKVGPIAFQDDETHRFGGIVPEIGDWVLYNVGDTFGFELGGRRCRFVEDVAVKAILERPDLVW